MRMKIWLTIMVLGVASQALCAQERVQEVPQETPREQVETPAAGANAGADVTRSAEPMPTTQPATTQPSTTQPSTTQPATRPAAATQPAAAAVTGQVLADRVRKLIREPEPTARRDAVRQQLVELTDHASQLYQNSTEPPVRLSALSVQMQALYTQIVEDPRNEHVERLLSQLRAAARRAKSLDQPDADAVGDFWLMMAELLDLNRMNLNVDDRRAQAAELMNRYIKNHPDAAPTVDVRAALGELRLAMVGRLKQINGEIEALIERDTGEYPPASPPPLPTTRPSDGRSTP